MSKNKQLTAANLKEELWATLQGLKNKKINPQLANSIAKQSREIINVVKTEIAVAKLSGKTKNDKLIGFDI